MILFSSHTEESESMVKLVCKPNSNTHTHPYVKVHSSSPPLKIHSFLSLRRENTPEVQVLVLYCEQLSPQHWSLPLEVDSPEYASHLGGSQLPRDCLEIDAFQEVHMLGKALAL
jgi:hypothetical protein